MYNQRVNIVGELEEWITAVTENVTKDVLHHVWLEANYR
jgi:hypothetical protein